MQCCERWAPPASHTRHVSPATRRHFTPLTTLQAASAAAAGEGSGPDQRIRELERSLKDAQGQVASLTGELEAARKRAEDMSALVGSLQATQKELSSAYAALRTEREAETAADREAAAGAAARVQELEAERSALIAARDEAKQVGRELCVVSWG